jgi:hypothetical protein
MRAPLTTPLLVAAAGAHVTTFQPPVLITPPHSFVDGKEVNLAGLGRVHVD